MKRIVFFILLSLPMAIGTVNAQEHRKQYGVGIQPFYSTAFWSGSGKEVDSLNSIDKGLGGVNISAWYLVEWKRYSSIQVGLQYSMTGFQRRAEDVTFGITYHPDLPKITDWVQGDPRHIDFIYRTHYVGIPIFWNRELIRFRKSVSLHYYFTPGISFGFRVYDKTIAKTRGFGFNGENRFVLGNIYETQPFNAQLHLGGRLEYLISAKYRASAQPVINFPITPTFKGDNKAWVPSVGINLFVTLMPGKEAVE